MSTVTLLSVIARISPQVWDAIVPQGPLIRGRLDQPSTLNPQPLPPAEKFLTFGAGMAHELVRLAVETEIRGESSAGFVRELIDDWCRTPWPSKWPSPWPGTPRGEGPSPEPWDVAAARVVGAVIFASAGFRLAQSEELGAVFAKGAERLCEAAVSG
jgi:hypothetical protein